MTWIAINGFISLLGSRLDRGPASLRELIDAVLEDRTLSPDEARDFVVTVLGHLETAGKVVRCPVTGLYSIPAGERGAR